MINKVVNGSWGNRGWDYFVQTIFLIMGGMLLGFGRENVIIALFGLTSIAVGFFLIWLNRSYDLD